MGFWDKHLGGQQAPNGGGQYPQRAPVTQPQQFEATPVVAPLYPTTEQQQQPQTMEEALRSDVTVVPPKAVATRIEVDRCPSCGSGNWYTGRSNGAPTKPHCYDCGFPFVQAGSGMGELAHVRPGGSQAAPQVHTAPPEASPIGIQF